MAVGNLGRLRRVDLRHTWFSEAQDFTPWLAQAENLQLLAETIGIELELDTREKEVGPFRADILCKDTSDNWVLIENQLEKTDHQHLGQLLTYAGGLNAVTIVWVAQKFTEEHRAALNWLNEHTDEKINLFGLEIELWQIGDSAIAPKFNIISQPNDWSRAVQQTAAREISEHNQLQLRFWTAFREYMEANKSPVRCQKPHPQHWMSHAIGRAGTGLSSIISTWNSVSGTNEPEIRAELFFNGPNAKNEFVGLESQKERVEQMLGFPLTWHNPEGKTACRAYTRQDADFLDEALWTQHFAWLRQRLEIMHRVFAPIVKTLKISTAPGPDSAF